ncbi:MAG: OmpA family protein [Thermodesulfobacteriota bacterium]|nr:OmpA family protein [Thermodesulfobacteriota bacterium]
MKMTTKLRILSLLIAVISAVTLIGCANYEVNTGRGKIPGMFIRSEMQEADRALDAARQAGKDKLCPDEFKAAEDARNNAYNVFASCRTEEGAALAKKATEKANALCPPKAPVMAVPAPAPAPPADTDGDGVIDTLDKCPGTPSGVAVDNDGCPLDSDKDGVYDYLDKCPGTPIGTKVDKDGCPIVIAPAPKPAPVKICTPTVLDINFDTNKAEIKPEFHNELKKVGDFLNEFPKAKGTIDGHTDNIGSKKYNDGLSKRRAESVSNYIIKNFGIDAGRIGARGYGFSKPIADNKTKAGRSKNRRIEANFTCE